MMSGQAKFSVSTGEIFLVLTLLFFAISFYGAHNSSLYLAWGSSVSFVLVYLFLKFICPTVSSVNAKIFMMMASWALLSFLFTPFVGDKAIHLKILSIAFSYVVFSLVAVNFLFKKKILIKGVGYLLLFWIFLEVLPLVLFLMTAGQIASLGGVFQVFTIIRTLWQ